MDVSSENHTHFFDTDCPFSSTNANWIKPPARAQQKSFSKDACDSGIIQIRNERSCKDEAKHPAQPLHAGSSGGARHRLQSHGPPGLTGLDCGSDATSFRFSSGSEAASFPSSVAGVGDPGYNPNCEALRIASQKKSGSSSNSLPQSKPTHANLWAMCSSRISWTVKGMIILPVFLKNWLASVIASPE